MNKILLNVIPNIWAEEGVWRARGALEGVDGGDWRVGCGLAIRWWDVNTANGCTGGWNYLWWNPPDEDDPRWERIAST